MMNSYARTWSRQHGTSQSLLAQGWKGCRQLLWRQSGQKGGYSSKKARVPTRALILPTTALIDGKSTQNTSVIVNFPEG